jgi:hypothetical protein
MKPRSVRTLIRRSIGLTAVGLSAAVIPPATATVTAVVTDNLNGTWTYAYTVFNAGTFDIWSWFLDLEILPDWNQNDVFAGGDVDVPANSLWWIAEAGTPLSGIAAQDFRSLDASEDVQPGHSLGEFSFTSAFPPGIADYYEFGPLGDSSAGTVAAPIPEPMGFGAVLALGLAGWVSLGRGRREP